MNLKAIIGVIVVVVIVGAVAVPILFQDPHVAKGRKLFDRNCVPCHGESGQGNGYNADNLDPHPRDLTDGTEKYMAKLTNEEIYEVIDIGGYGVGLAPLMPSFGKMFSEEEIWSLVAYVRTFHRYDGEKVAFSPEWDTKAPRIPQVTEAEYEAVYEEHIGSPEAEEEMMALGEELFAEFGCIACHRIGDEGGRLGPDLTHVGFMLQPQFIYRWIRNPKAFKPHTRMPNLGLNEADALAVTLYLSTLDTPNAQEAPPMEAADAIKPASMSTSP